MPAELAARWRGCGGVWPEKTQVFVQKRCLGVQPPWAWQRPRPVAQDGVGVECGRAGLSEKCACAPAFIPSILAGRQVHEANGTVLRVHAGVGRWWCCLFLRRRCFATSWRPNRTMAVCFPSRPFFVNTHHYRHHHHVLGSLQHHSLVLLGLVPPPLPLPLH